MSDKEKSEVNPYEFLTALVVDDHQPMATTIKSMLIALGFKRIFIAPNGIEAIKILRHHDCDLIISDWNMPQMNGLETVTSYS